MTRPETRPFTDADLPAAGRLLAERHRAHRRGCPLLPDRFEDALAAEAEVARAWEVEGASGAIALRDGEPVGYLVGAPKQSTLWGPNVWVEEAGHATREPEAMRDLYASAAAGWVAAGHTAQYVVVPASDRALVDAWFRLGFGGQHTFGLRSVPSEVPAPPTGLVVRPAGAEDAATLARLDLELPAHHGLAPTFSAGHPDTFEGQLEKWEADFETGYLADFGVFVAERDGAPVGSVVGCPIEKSGAHSGLLRPDRAGLLAFAAVVPSARGLGVGRALGEAVLSWCAGQKYDVVATDWRTTNLLSSRTWPALGFEETFLRLHRLIGY